jgi:hypothetical protein
MLNAAKFVLSAAGRSPSRRAAFSAARDVRAAADVASGLLVETKKKTLAVGAEPGVDVVPVAAGQLEALFRIGEIELVELRVLLADRRVDEPLAVRREHRRTVVERVAGELVIVPSRRSVDEDVALIAHDAGEGDLRPVGRERRRLSCCSTCIGIDG